MKDTVHIALLGEFDQNRPSHAATIDALNHSAVHISINVEIEWISTHSFEIPANNKLLKGYDGVFGAPGEPVSSLGYINGIQCARKEKIPYLGT